MTMSPTELALIAVHRSPLVRLDAICDHYFNLKPAIAARRARLNQLPVPTWRSVTRKSPYLVHVHDLAEWIDKSRESASTSWSKSQL